MPQMHRYRTVTIGDLATMTGHHGGKACPTLHSQADCNTHECPIDCVVSLWTKYDACTKTCNGGERHRTRSITTPVEHGGKACPLLAQTEVCGAEKCGTDCKIAGEAADSDQPNWITMPHGWKGAGSKANYCNQCSCLDGEYSCTKRHCGPIPDPAAVCTDMTCSYTLSKEVSEPVMVVNHHHKNFGTRHKCGYDLFTDTCVCHCYA